MKRVKETLRNRDKVNPKEALNRILDAFQEKGITPDQIVRFLGHELEIITQDELMALRGTYGAIQDGEVTWVQLLKDVEEDREGALKRQAEAAAARKGAKEKPADQQTKGSSEGNAKPSAAAQAAAATAGAAQTMAGGSLDIPVD